MKNLASLFLLSAGWTLQAADWRPVTPAELSRKQSSIDPTADAEAIFRDVRIANILAGFSYPTNVKDEYIRLKIYNDRGKEKYSTVQIAYEDQAIISDVQGRTIHPDGTIIELQHDAVFQKMAAKGAGLKVKTISFTLPAVEPGSIIEYRWKENAGEHFDRYMPLNVQEEYPVDEANFHIKPPSNAYIAMPVMRFIPFNCDPLRNDNEMNGYQGLVVRNVPAFHQEPFQPPVSTIKAWILLYYEDNSNSGKDKYWTALGHEMHSEYGQRIKVNGAAKDLATEIISKGKDDEEKVAFLAAYCRTHIKDLAGDDITTEEREKSSKKELVTTADVLKRQVGWPIDINLAFIALARAAGYEAEIARLADRGRFLFSPTLQSRYFLNATDSAVKVNGKWKFYDITDQNLAPGMVGWREQGVSALVTNSKDAEWVTTPILTSKETKKQRAATLKLSADGELEGEIHQYFWGNEGIDWRERLGKSTDAEREEEIRKELKERFADFDVSHISVSMKDPARPVGVSYHIVVRNYAQRTGKRLFVRPAYFAAGQGAFFSDEKRTSAVYFPYPWSESDVVEIQLPDGFQLDHPDAPQGFNFPPIGSYQVKMYITNKNSLRYERGFSFGTDAFVFLDATNYPQLKKIFDQIHISDDHALSLKAADATTAAPSGQ